MTLFELAVVLVISFILIGLALFSVQGLLARTKVSRVREDHRAVSRALQNYLLDYSSLPPAKNGLATLTRPTAYLGAVPRDPFQARNGGYLYLAPDSHEIAAVIISPGPDGDFDLPEELWRFASTKDIDKNLLPVRQSKMNSFASPGAELAFPQFRSSGITEAEAAILSTYLRLGRYDSLKGEDGDIVTVIRY